MVKESYIDELNISKLLKKGSNGNDVKKVQEWINLWRYYDRDWYHNIAVDGDFGPLTEKIIKEFQKKHKLTVDGVVGDQTFQKLTSHMIGAFTKIEGNDLRKLIIDYANQHLKNIPRELYNSNQGPWVRAYMDGNEGKEWAWCMGFVQTILDQAFATLGKTFLSLMPKTYSCDVVGEHGKNTGKLIRNNKLRLDPHLIEPGDIFLNVKTPWDWTHTGIIISVDDETIHTIEGNTNDEGSREGFEVCQRIRNFKTKDIDIFKVS